MNDLILPILFFIVSLIYSSVGLGGGSAYTALMIIFGMNYKIIPPTSLTLNIFVSFIGMVNFWRRGHGRFDLILPFLITSIPMTYIGGSLDLPKNIFYMILFFSLMLITIKIYFLDNQNFSFRLVGFKKWLFILLVGTVLGFIAGSVGIGGGIYLVPIIFIFGLGTEKEAAATGVAFIFINSIVGLISRVQFQIFDVNVILPLLLSVVFGGFLGSYFGSVKFKPNTIQKLMGIILIIGMCFLIKEIL